MRIMAETPDFLHEYDFLYDPSPVEAGSTREDRHGIQLECWGRAGYNLPRLSEIFIPSHVIRPKNHEEHDPVFRRLGETIGTSESFSLYTDTSRLDAVFEAGQKSMHNDLNTNREDVQAEGEIFMSDSSNCSEVEENIPPEKQVVDCTNKQDGHNELTDDTEKNDCLLNEESSKPKNAEVRNWLQNNDFEANRPVKHVLVRRDLETENKLPINHKISQNKAEEAERPNYTVVRRNKTEEDTISFNCGAKKSKNKRKPHIKDKGNKNDPMSLADLSTLMSNKHFDDRQEVDELQLYYTHGYNRNSMPVCSQFDFPELPTTTDLGTETKAKQPSPLKSQLDIKSIAKSILGKDCDKNANKSAADFSDPGYDILMIENLPKELSTAAALQLFLEDYGKVHDLSISRVGGKLKAAVNMDCDLEWVAELLNGNRVSGDSSDPLNCYVKKRNVR